MSRALNKAIYARTTGIEVLLSDALTAQQNLIALLGTDPNKTKPAVYYMNKGSRPAFDCVVFRPRGGTPDDRFKRQTGSVGDVIYDFEAWSKSLKSGPVEDIIDALERLFVESRQTTAQMTLTSGKVFHSKLMSEPAFEYDEGANLWFGILSVAFVEARY